MSYRPLLVFAGQSNMMGAAVFPVQEQIVFRDSFEYLHKPKRMGAAAGAFKAEAFPCGEFSYIDLAAAYGAHPTPGMKSTLADYRENTHFCPAMSNRVSADGEDHPFAYFSEATASVGTTLAPYIAAGLEAAGYACAYAHIAKGGVPIRYYLEGAAADYFDEKVLDFFADSETRFAGDDMRERVLIWLQGESDAGRGFDYYKESLHRLWARAERLGFTRLFIVRIDHFGIDKIADVMRAQEQFCRECPQAEIITRVGSFFPYVGREYEGWYASPPTEELLYTRDSFYGSGNQHINDKGFRVIAKYAVPNMLRVMVEGKPPVLEEEMIAALK